MSKQEVIHALIAWRSAQETKKESGNLAISSKLVRA